MTPYDVEELVTLMDEHRTGKVVAVAEGATVDGDDSYPVAWDGARFTRAEPARPAACFSVGDTPTGFFAKLDPCAELVPAAAAGAASTPACLRSSTASTASTFGALEPAPDVA